MKISKADFEQMKAKYDQEVRRGRPGRGKKQDITDQTNWIVFDRSTLEEILADPKATGIKFHFTEYTEATAKAYYPENPDEYVGRINLVMTAHKENGQSEISDADVSTTYYNKAQMCPPFCQ